MAGCLDLLLKINGVDRTSLLIHETLTITQTNDGLNSTCAFDLLDEAVIREDIWTVEETRVEDGDVITGYLTFFPQTKVDVCITNVAETLIYFAGILSRVHATHLGQIEIISGFVEPETQVLRCECADYNQVLEEMVIDDFREYGGLLDDALIDAVFDEFVAPFDDPYNIDYATFVTAVPHAFDIITFDSITVRQFMDTLCGITGAVWYVDYSRKLHYAADEADLVPPWHLSDNPVAGTSFAYFDDITKEKDATNLVNMVFVVCATDLLPVSLWFIDQESKDKYGPHRAIVRDTSLLDIDDIEDKGNSILEKFSDPIVTYVLKTYKGTPGGNDGVHPATPIIRAGQHIRVVCAFYDLDETFKINNLVITFPSDGTPVFEITCGGLDSSASGSATRSTLDQIHVPNITPSSLPIAARGWGHDLEFTATDYRTVEWTAGTITTADGQEFDIAPAADTGNMAAVTYVYLDTGLSLTALQHSVNAVDAIGLGKILIAVCAPGIPAAAPQPEVLAMYQVFGGGIGTTIFLHADNIAGNCITANELYVNQLSAITADMGTLTAGLINITGGAGMGRVILNVAGVGIYDAADNLRIHLSANDGTFEITTADAGDRMELDTAGLRFYDGANLLIDLNKTNATFSMKSAAAGDRVELDTAGLRFYDGANLLIDLNATNATFTLKSGAAGNPRIEISNSEIAGYDGADVKQFYLSAADGIAYAGAGAVILDKDGLRVVGSGATGDSRRLRFMYDDAGTERRMAQIYADWVGGANPLHTVVNARRDAGAPWPANVVVMLAAIDTIAGTDVRLYVHSGGVISTSGTTYFSADKDVRIGEGLYVGGLGVNPASGEITATSHIAGGGRWYFGAQGSTYYLHRSGENLVWHNASGDHVVQVV